MKKRIGDIVWVIVGLTVISCYFYQMKRENLKLLIFFIISVIILVFCLKMFLGRAEETTARNTSLENDSPLVNEKSSEEVVCAQPSNVLPPPTPSKSRFTSFNFHIGGFIDLSFNRHRTIKK